MILPVVEDISQLAKIRSMAQALESLATQVYLSHALTRIELASPPQTTYMHRAVIDEISKAFAHAYETIAHHGKLLTKAGPPVPVKAGGAADDCPPGWCPDGASCHPCDGTTLFPSIVWPANPARVPPPAHPTPSTPPVPGPGL